MHCCQPALILYSTGQINQPGFFIRPKSSVEANNVMIWLCGRSCISLMRQQIYVVKLRENLRVISRKWVNHGSWIREFLVALTFCSSCSRKENLAGGILYQLARDKVNMAQVTLNCTLIICCLNRVGFISLSINVLDQNWSIYIFNSISSQ